MSYIKKFYGLPNLYQLAFFQIIGKLAVVLFFVLSGFLITTLLLREQQIHQKINFRNFYLRRIFRIWPLYFLILVLGFFIIPYFSMWSNVPSPAFRPIG
ncbi:acyltransferase family protein [Weeksellaceae bacterium Sa1CVA4]|uniref:Acyltransferase family protein n=1 Tax=Kaistella pullorum TaxID=2763074 RepID=A0ABR8WIW2_9FLAO|nr:acyltransferase family protein [Kaistella pullorum]